MKMNRKMLVVVVALMIIALSVPTIVASAKTLKFTFQDVTLTDSTGTVEHGVIEASTKQVGNGSQYIVCDYYTENWATYLGQYQDATFFSSDPDTVKNFCIQHYPDRTLP